MNPTTLLLISAGAIVILFMLLCFICYKGIHNLNVLLHPKYRHPNLTWTEQRTNDIANQRAQINFCVLVIVLAVAAIIPMLTALLQLSK